MKNVEFLYIELNCLCKKSYNSLFYIFLLNMAYALQV